MLANGQIEHPGKESSTASNTGLSRVTAQGDAAQGGLREQRPLISLCCALSQLENLAVWQDRVIAARSGEVKA